MTTATAPWTKPYIIVLINGHPNIVSTKTNARFSGRIEYHSAYDSFGEAASVLLNWVGDLAAGRSFNSRPQLGEIRS